MRQRNSLLWALLLALSAVLVVASLHVAAYLDQRRFAVAQPWLDLAIRDLAYRLNTDTRSIRTQHVEPTEFSDTSLGALEAGHAYLPAITPGYVIRLVADGSVYEYRAGGGRLLLMDPA